MKGSREYQEGGKLAEVWTTEVKALMTTWEWNSKQRKQKVQRLQGKNVQGGVELGPEKNPAW